MSKIIKQSNGKFRIQVYDELGKRHRLAFAKKSEAESYIRKIDAHKHELSQIKHELIKIRVHVTSAVSDFWIGKIDIRPKTRQKYEAEISQFMEFCKMNGISYIDEFSREHADKFRALLISSNASPKTINSYLSRLKSVFEEQINRDSIIRNPTSHLKNLPMKRKTLLERENEYYTENEVQKFFQQDIDPIYRDVLVSLFLTGVRYEELAHLTWARIDFGKRLIMVRSTEGFITKTPSAERDIPISGHLYKLLQERASNSKAEFVFPSRTGAKLSERTMLEVCKRIAEAAGIMKNATLHKFRHTFSSLLSHHSISYEVREYLLGHKPNGSLTGHYTKLDPNKLHYVVNILDEILEGKNDN